MSYGELLLDAVSSLTTFITTHFWEVFMILVFLIRKRSRWIGLAIILCHILWEAAPWWVWVIATIFAIGYEIDELSKTRNK